MTGRHLQPAESSKALVQADPNQTSTVEDETLDLRVIMNAVIKRKWVVISILVIALAIGVLQTVLTVPVYRSTAVIQIEHSTAQILRIQDFEAGPRSWEGVQQFLQTQYEIIQGRQLAEDVVRRQEVWDHPELTGEIRQRSLMGELKALPRRIRNVFDFSSEPERTRTVDPEAQREMAIRRAGAFLRSKISVDPRPESRLVNVSVSSFDPRFAARMANAVVAEYMRSSMQRRYDAGQEAREFLEEQMAEMRIALERADQALIDFAQENQVADLNERIERTKESMNGLNQQLNAVQQELLQLEAYKDLIDRGQADDVRLLRNDSELNQLEQNRAALSTEYASLSQRYLEDFPQMVELRGQMEELDRQIAQRRDEIIDGVLTEYNNRQAEARTLERAIDDREDQILALNQQGVQYNILRREFQTNQDLYEGMLQRMKEIGVAAGLQENNIAVIDPALAAGRPVLPQPGRTLTMALAVGLGLGIGLALLLEFIDNTVRFIEDVEQLVGRPVLGLIPMVKLGDKRLGGSLGRKQEERAVSHYSEQHPKSAVSEAFRSLRTSLMFSTPQGLPKTILVTSPGPGEGKTTTAINLATVMAQNGAKVLIIDADLRKPRLHRDFKVPHAPGLTNRIAGVNGGEESTSSAIIPTTVDGLFIMPSGNQAPNPAELLSSERMSKIIAMASRAFDCVVIDTAPILGLADSLVLSRAVDGVIMVMAAGKTTKTSVKACVRRLNQVQAPLLGQVLNRVDMESPDYAYYSAYYYNYSGGGSEFDGLEDEPKALEKTA
jgi:capsular exopolysaccharide synthesis family protein